MLLRITHYGEPVLRQRGATIKSFDSRLAALARDMLETMVHGEGIGLAAQQVGHAVRLFVADLLSRTAEAEEILLDGKSIPPALLFPFTAVNPVVEYLPGKTHTVEEGCLSFPGVRGDVARPLAVRLRYQDLQGQAHVLETSGLFARVIQHEYDHVEGVLFTDRMDPGHVEDLDPKLKKLKRETRLNLRQLAAESRVASARV
jgi:peptide deformylase